MSYFPMGGSLFQQKGYPPCLFISGVNSGGTAGKTGGQMRKNPDEITGKLSQYLLFLRGISYNRIYRKSG